MNRWALIVQSVIFSAGVFVLLLLLSVAVHFPLGRVVFAVMVSGICLAAELFALFRLMRWMWKLSYRLSDAILRKAHPAAASPTLLTEVKN